MLSFICKKLQLFRAFSKIARTNATSKMERLDCSLLFNSEHRSKLSTDYWSGERWFGIVEVQLAKMTRAVATKQASVTALHVSVAWVFFFLQKNKASHHKQRQLNGILCRCFTS